MTREVIALAFLNFKQGVRERLFLGAVFFFIFFLSLCILMGLLSPGETDKVLRSSGLAGIELSALILLIFSLVLNFYKEKEERVLEIYLTHFSRSSYLWGKLIGYSLIAFFYILICGAGYLVMLVIYKAFLWQVAVSLYNIFLKLSLAIGISLVFSSLFSSPVLALLSSLFLYMSSEMAYPALKILSMNIDASGYRLPLFKIIYYLLPNMHKLDIKALAVYGELPSWPYFILITIYTFIYIFF
ncbi:MAG: hypothetical protein KKE64_07400, partial [Candidatus Omnitrophica bacterium]|nr:hypothetical protein [Candidatus Omnitrophota bacterium]